MNFLNIAYAFLGYWTLVVVIGLFVVMYDASADHDEPIGSVTRQCKWCTHSFDFYVDGYGCSYSGGGITCGCKMAPY